MAQKAKRTKSKEPSFEEHLDQLEAVVEALEGEELSLEASLARYQEGVAHLKACRSMLDAAEGRLAELVRESEAGAATERPLRVGDEGLEPDAS